MFKLSRIFFGFMLSIPVCVYGEEIKFGIGATANNDVMTLYAPMTRGELFVEPTLTFSKTKASTAYNDGVSSGNSSFDSEYTALGVGIFRRAKVAENIYLYGGGRVGFSKIRTNHTDSVGTTTNGKGHGHYISPSVGVEREFSDNFSIGLELAYSYSKQKSDYSATSYSSSYEQKIYTTGTKMIVRYRF